MRRLLAAALICGLGVGEASTAEWWQDKFVYDGSDSCEGNDSVRTYSAATVEGWEESCTIAKQTPIVGLDALILDLDCSFVEGDPPWKERRILFKLDGDEVAQFPPFTKLQRCSKLTGDSKSEKVPEQPECNDRPALFRTPLRNNPDTTSYQELEFDPQMATSAATLTEYRMGKAVWVSRGDYTCSNGAVICYLIFPVMGSGEPISMPIEIVEGKTGPTVVIPSFSQSIYQTEKHSVDLYNKPYGGLVADLLNGFAPAVDELTSPYNVYSFAECKANATLED